MDSDAALTFKKAKMIKLRLESLDRANTANRNIPECGPGSLSDRTRISLVNTKKKKLKKSMASFNELREKIGLDYNEIVQRWYFTVIGNNPELISTGENETFMQIVIQEQGRGQVFDTISEMKERHAAVKEIEKGLYELNQVFLEMSMLVEAQDEQLNDIQRQLSQAKSFVKDGMEGLQSTECQETSKEDS
ncbi:hypothetical protein GIB67_035389 [Kingdonia uniflora]|uniref:t-SNARE coiled-coil homology domain-containing protein n=1 Tax=Kingdonia uniflora TaxID=39325 RepID=A0A7J7MMP0_9MAGN|nr:hypothetical protein GIB67_035389 [Kingdonia uniflora]